jgi:hypothetical protein
MCGVHNKMALFVFWSILASAFLTIKCIFAVRLMVRPLNIPLALKGTTHCKTSAAGFLPQNHGKSIFDFSYDKMLTIKHEGTKTRTKRTFFRRSVFWCSSVAAFPDNAAAAPVLVCSVSPWPALALPAAAVRRATAAANTAAAAAGPAFALRIYAAGGIRIRQHCNSHAQFGDLLITQL